MQQCELITLIEQTAPLHLAAPWDHSGVQVAAHRSVISHLAVCLDPTPTSIRAALDKGADMVLSHHPLSMSGRFLDRLDAYHEVATLLLEAHVPLYASHTSLDANPSGPVGWLARELSLLNCAVLEPAGSATEYGFGLCGDLPHSVDGTALLNLLHPWIGDGQRTLAGPDFPDTISRLALCPGSGGSMIEAAHQGGAHVMITGDIKYHIALESPLSVIDVGHFCLEEEMMRRFAEQLSASLTVSFIPGCDPLRPFPVL